MVWMWKSSDKRASEPEAGFWEQSGAVYRIKEKRDSTKREKETKEAGTGELKGQIAGKDLYVERRRLENTYGRVSFLTDGKGRVGIEMARSSFFGEEERMEGRKSLNVGKSVCFGMEGGRGYVEGSMADKSAFRWTESSELSEKRIMNELRRLSVSLSQKTLCEMTPEADREAAVHGHSSYFRHMEENLKRTVEESRKEKKMKETEEGQLWLLQKRLFGSEQQEKESIPGGTETEEDENFYGLNTDETVD